MKANKSGRAIQEMPSEITLNFIDENKGILWCMRVLLERRHRLGEEEAQVDEEMEIKH